MLVKNNPNNFRHHIFCAMVAELNILLEDINVSHNPPGLKPQESTFLKLIEAISNGCKIMVAKGGTVLKFYAGIVTNNEGVELHFDCGLDKGISYYLEYLLLMGIISKTALNIHLYGLTNTANENSIDTIQTQLIPFMKNHYGFDNELSMKVISRGYLPDGGGHVHVVIPAIRKLNRVNLQQKGYIKRIRGTCAGSKISTSILNQIKDKCKAKFLQFLPDVWIYSDFYKGDKASKSPGYNLTLQAESTTSATITFDSCYQVGSTDVFVQSTIKAFLDEVEHSGFISTNYQWFVLTLMSLSEKKTSSIKLGRISPFTVECLRIIKETLGVLFQIQESQSQRLSIFRCLGVGYENYARIVK